MPKKGAKPKEKKVKPFKISDRFTTPESYRNFLGKKVKDFSKEERKIYDSIAQQYRRKPFGDELAVNDSSFLPIGEMPFATTAPLNLAEELVEPPPPNDPPPYIPTIADMRAVLRQAGALDRTPPQLQHTPITQAVKGGDEVRAVEPLNVGDRMGERLIAAQLAEYTDEERRERIRNRGLDQYINRKQALVDALGVIGQKKRAERGAELMAELAANERPPPLDEARRLVEEAINEYDRPARAINAERRDQLRELMDSEQGDLKRALDEFNIPSEYLLKPTKRESQAAILKKNAPEWYERNLPVPVSPRERRLDLQFGADDPDATFDPDPVVEFEEDEEWMREYLREDVLEATARREIAAGRREDPRPARRLAREQAERGFDLSRASSGTSMTSGSTESTTLSQIELDNLLLERLAVLTEQEADEAERARELRESFIPLEEALPPAPPQKDLSGFRRQIALQKGLRTDIPTLELENPWKVGTREHKRFQDKQLSANLKFPPAEFTAERGRAQFGFDPQPFTLEEREVEPFRLDAPTNLPSWARSARSGVDTFTPQYRPPEADIGDDTYIDPIELGVEGGKSVLRQEAFVDAPQLLPSDIAQVKEDVGTKEVVAAEPEREVIQPEQTLETTTTGGSTGAGEKKSFAPKVAGRRKKKKATKKAPVAVQEAAGQTAADFFGFDEDIAGFAGGKNLQSTAEQREERELRAAGVGGVVFEGAET